MKYLIPTVIGTAALAATLVAGTGTAVAQDIPGAPAPAQAANSATAAPPLSVQFVPADSFPAQRAQQAAPGAKADSTASSGQIFCTLEAETPYWSSRTGVNATGYAECTATPDVWHDAFVIWGWDGSKYQQVERDTSNTPPTAPDGNGGVIKNFHGFGSTCQHNWVYHAQLTAQAFHGNWANYNQNSSATTLC